MKVKATALLHGSGFISLPQAENNFSENACVAPIQKGSEFDHSSFFKRKGINVCSPAKGKIILFLWAFLLF